MLMTVKEFKETLRSDPPDQGDLPIGRGRWDQGISPRGLGHVTFPVRTQQRKVVLG